jgi:hypothetical protein
MVAAWSVGVPLGTFWEMTPHELRVIVRAHNLQAKRRLEAAKSNRGGTLEPRPAKVVPPGVQTVDGLAPDVPAADQPPMDVAEFMSAFGVIAQRAAMAEANRRNEGGGGDAG